MKSHALFVSTAALAVLCAFASLAGTPAHADPAPVLNLGTHIQSRNGVATVLRGDTLWRISQRYDVPLEDIAAANHLKPPYTLSPGQRLALPAPRLHTVGGHDTLYHLSQMYGVPVEHLAAANHLRAPYTLHPGERLRIPSGHAKAQPVRVASATPQRKYSKVLGTLRVHRETARTEEKKPVKTASLIAPVRRAPEPVTTVSGSHRAGFIWPVHGKVISSYGAKSGGLYNDGINIAAPRRAPVAAAADGVVVYVGDRLKSYGNLVLIRHPGGMVTTYAHLSTVTVRAGQSVRRGQVIGSVGSTGSVSSAQLHFEVRNGTRTMDPRKYLG
ncbi:MAG: peptidoglycan DD-metalloendopeptidase family protein [Alphaproteobacteria bacterium]|nr:peptidoglycan DD-metalloendopeptidase family protein [Alphaproteobacteria bacterium]